VDPVFLVAVALVATGVAGTVLPALPGVPLVLAGLALAAWRDGFEHVGGWTLALLVALTVLSFAVDVAGAALGLKRTRASGWAVGGALAGLAIGVFFGLPGLLLGPFAGAFVAEWLVRRDLRQAGRVGLGAWIGLVVASALRLAVAFAMVAVFALAWVI